MDDHEIAFVICVNNNVLFEECRYYIERLHVPEGFAIDIIAIYEAKSMCAAYNLGMQSSKAKYKIYMHQDVFIRNVDFLKSVIDIFDSRPTVGMIGMVGGNFMPQTGVTYRAWNTGTVDCRDPDMAYYLAFEPQVKQDAIVEAVDGLLIATQCDLPWREDLFRHFDFYDVSQSFEMRKAGYEIMVPYQSVPWVIHDSSFAKLDHYDEGRKICLKEYPEYLYAEGGYSFEYNEEWNMLSEQLALQVKQMMEQGEWEQAASVIASYRSGKMKNSTLEMLGVMSDICQKELENVGDTYTFYNIHRWQEMYEKYMKIRFGLRRMELGMPEQEYAPLAEAIKERRISYDALMILLIHSIVDKKTCLQKFIGYYAESGQTECVKRAEVLFEQLKKRDLSYAYTKARRGGLVSL